MRLNPRYPPLYLLNLGFAYRMAGLYEEALTPLKKSLPFIPNSGTAHLHLGVCYAGLGWLKEARAEMAAFQRLAPIFSLEVFKSFLPYRDPADVERTLAALRKAGLR